jgi:hypothetical protein
MKPKDLIPWVSILFLIVSTTVGVTMRISKLEERLAVSEALMVRVEQALRNNQETLTAVRVDMAGRVPR